MASLLMGDDKAPRDDDLAGRIGFLCPGKEDVIERAWAWREDDYRACVGKKKRAETEQ